MSLLTGRTKATALWNLESFASDRPSSAFRLARVVAAGVVAVLCATGGASVAVAASPAPNEPANLTLLPGASFTALPDLGVVGSRTFLYQPAEKFSPAPMLTPVLFVYPDIGYPTDEAAWSSLKALGLIDLAESKKAVIVVQNPTGGTWGADDLTVHQGVTSYIWGANTAASGKPALTYNRLNYVIAEGRGATFANQYLTQAPAVNRIAGIATFGGSMPDVPEGAPVPAYIAGGSEKAIDFYKSVNDVDSQSGDAFVNTVNPAKKVIVQAKNAQRFRSDLIADAYASLFEHTARQALTTTVWTDVNTPEEFVLMERPNLEELDLSQVLVSGDATGTTGQTRWYEWVPDEIIDDTDGDKTYPLVISLHGSGDHEIYEAESNGWIDVAGDERIIVAAPFTGSTPAVVNLLAELKAKYPIDPTRVYLTGFSAGGVGTINASTANPSMFTAIAPMAAPFGSANALAAQNDLIDLPTLLTTGENDVYAIVDATAANPYPAVSNTFRNLIRAYAGVNNIPIPATFDFAAHHIWGIPLENHQTLEYPAWGYPLKTAELSKDGVPLMKFMLGSTLEHTHYLPYGEVAWDFLKQFSRDQTTKAITYTAAD